MTWWQVLDQHNNVERVEADDLLVSMAGALVFTNRRPYRMPDQSQDVVIRAYAPGGWIAVNLLDGDQ